VEVATALACPNFVSEVASCLQKNFLTLWRRICFFTPRGDEACGFEPRESSKAAFTKSGEQKPVAPNAQQGLAKAISAAPITSRNVATGLTESSIGFGEIRHPENPVIVEEGA